jgi:hypothetical protein
MSDSYHVTIKNFRRCTNRELGEQAKDSESDLAQWAKKRRVKKEALNDRKAKKQEDRDLKQLAAAD